MNILQIGITAVITCILCMTVKERPEISVLLVFAGGIIIMTAVMPYISDLLGNINAMAQSAGIDSDYIVIMFKVTGISAITVICSAICRDAGQSGIAAKVEIAGRISVITAALPVIKHLFNIISGI